MSGTIGRKLGQFRRTSVRRRADRLPTRSRRASDCLLEMPTLSPRAAAYTRTGILRRFLDQRGESIPPRVDNGYAQERLQLKGGDVRAFLQSVRVLGLVDPY